MLYISAKSYPGDSVDKTINKKLIDKYLQKRGYTMNYVLGNSVMVKGFTCVKCNDDNIEV